MPREIFNRSDFTECPSCHAPVLVKTYPALSQTVTVKPAENIGLDTEASCFFHAQKKAEVACSSCGRYLCSLCDIEFEGGHICAACLAAGQKKKKIKNLETHRVLYDSIALAAAIIPMITVWLTVITAPVSMYIAIRYFRAPTSVTGRTKIRFILAIMISSLQLTGWSFLLYRFLK